ncbi:hypothetical protein HPL003_21905 [Paenibacillus terrae HPL-003]|uniref:Uncharacterized protein n=1 Tax=Paenibacillus terrae (strain HPL-003) TaxID=985665 RepID=G7VQ40_PAETH|nr:hypothetical protein HPL003_21905 [Paenibacillus terrae HPL-003]
MLLLYSPLYNMFILNNLACFFLEGSPYNYSSQVAGLFGLFGVAGALVVPWIDRITDRFQPKVIIGAMIIVLAVSFALFFLYGTIFIVLCLVLFLWILAFKGLKFRIKLAYMH